jgi:DNA polymerase-3 subunit beta
MKIEVKRKDFLEPLGVVQHVSERRATQPILSHVLIRTDEKDLTLFATDLEVFVKVRGKCEKAEKIEIAVPARELYELIKELDTEKIEIESKNGSVSIKAQKGNYRMNSIPASQFPLPPEKEFSDLVFLSSADLLSLIEKTAFAASNDESRYVLTGILVEIEKGFTRFVASYGHRLAMFERQVENTHSEHKFILPKNAVSDIKRVLPSVKKGFEIKVTEEDVLFWSEDVEIWVKTIQEEYPNWRDVIPSDDELVSRCIVKVPEFKKCLKRASLFASSKFPYVNISVESGKVIIESESDELGSCVEEIDADTSGKTKEKIALSVKYLQDAISSLDSPLASIKIFGDTSPCVVEPVSGEGALNLIMPLKL